MDASRGSQQREAPLPGEHGGGGAGFKEAGVPTRALTPGSTWSFPAGASPNVAACLGSRQCAPTQYRVDPLTVDQGKVDIAPNRGGPVLTVRGPSGILPSG